MPTSAVGIFVLVINIILVTNFFLVTNCTLSN